MNTDNFKPAIVYTIYIGSTPEKVWQALTTAEFSPKYFSGFAVEVDLKVGGAFVARAPDGSVHISGEVIEVNAEALENPDLINSDPYAGGWLLRVRMEDPRELDELINEEEYAELTTEV